MPRMLIRPLSVGEVLDRSFQTLRHHFATLFLTALVAAVPLLAVYLAMGTDGMLVAGSAAPPSGGFMAVFFALIFLAMLLYGVVWAGLVDQVDRTIAGRPIDIGSGLKAGLRSLPRLIGAGIVLFLLLMALSLVVGILTAILVPLLSGGDSVGIGALVVGGLLAVLGIWLFIVWTPLTFLLVPAVVVEKAGPIAAVRQANRLAKGGRLRVIVIAFLAWLVVMLPTIAVPLLMGMGLSVWDPTSMAAGTISSTQFIVYQVAVFLISAATTPFLAAAMVFAWHDRRARREGQDMELASPGVESPVAGGLSA